MTIITFSSPPSQLSTIFLYIDLTEPCYSFPCLNGGTCIREKLEQFTCQCHRWFEGNTCERGNTWFPVTIRQWNLSRFIQLRFHRFFKDR
jgi:hypothetical protein